MPINAPDLVQGWLDRFGISAETDVNGTAIGDQLSTQFEITTPSRDLIRALEPLIEDNELSHVIANRDKEALEHFLWGKDTLDLLNLKPDLALDPAQVLGWLKPIQHRAYSISSSPNANPDEVHLTVAAVRWMNENRPHRGVCSTFLSDMVAEGSTAGVFVPPNKSGLLTRLDLAFSRDQSEKIYVQHRMTENGKYLYAQLEEGGYFYVCGDATHMAKDVDAAQIASVWVTRFGRLSKLEIYDEKSRAITILGADPAADITYWNALLESLPPASYSI